MLEDRYGLALSTRSHAARDAYVDGVDRFLAAEAGVDAAFEAAIAADPDFALAPLALACSLQAQGRGAEGRARLADAAAAAARAPVSDREAGQLRALGLAIEGKGGAARAAVRAHLAEHPRDALAAQTCMGTLGLIGFSGEPGREAEQLAFSTALAPHYDDDWWFLGQHAFAQMETGRLGPAEATIERALAGNPRSAHGAHVRAHLHYENGEAEAGYAYLEAWRRDYDRAGLMHCHVSWHLALWALERGDEAAMWRVIDADIAPDRGTGPPLNALTDMAAILCRAELAGCVVAAGRWAAVSAYGERFFPRPGIAFVDVHAALAHAMAGRGEALAKIVAEARGPAGDMVRALAEAFGAFAAGRWAEATAHLSVALADHARIGGSRAQRDLLEYAMAGALLRQGKGEEARRLLAIRRPRAASPAAVRGL